MSEPRLVRMAQIRRDAGLQARVRMSPATIEEYAEAMAQGAVFPPVTVFSCDKESDVFWLADGWHRFAAAEMCGMEAILACVMEGGKIEALKFALGSNARHGLRRSKEDKRKAVELALSVPEISHLPSGAPRTIRELAEICGVSVGLVHSVLMSKKRYFVHNKPEGLGNEHVKRKPHGDLPKIVEMVPPHERRKMQQEAERLDAAIREAEEELQRLADLWPKDRLHVLTVLLRNKALDLDPEVAEMNRKAMEEVQATESLSVAGRIGK